MPKLSTLLGLHRRAGISPATPAILRLLHLKHPAATPPPPSPPRPPRKPRSFTYHGQTWEDPFSWMSDIRDKVLMRHMNVCMEQEEKYTEAVMSDSEARLSKLQLEMASRLAYDISTPAFQWGPWLYYRRVEEGKQHPVLCRRLAKLHEKFVTHKSVSSGFDFTSGQKIEKKLVDYNQEAERFGGCAYEELSELSPDHGFIAYTMYVKDGDFFRLCVRNLNSGSLCSKPQADRVSSIAWARGGKALVYVVTNQKKRPCRIYCSMIGSPNEDVLLLKELDEKVHLSVRHTKDFNFVTVNAFSPASSKVFLINAANPLAGLSLVWECDSLVQCVVEHLQGLLYLFTDAPKEDKPVDYCYLLRSPVEVSNSPRIWEDIFMDDPDLIIEDVDFCISHLVLTLREGRHYKLASLSLPLPARKGPVSLKELQPHYLPLPKYVSQISPGPNYDYNSSTMRFTISSPVMPDAVVDYDLSKGQWKIIQQQDVLLDKSKALYGESSISPSDVIRSIEEVESSDCNLWNDLSEFYACEHHNVTSYDGVEVPLTVVYSPKKMKEGNKPGLLRGHGSYGKLLSKRWHGEMKTLLDRGWIVAFADVRGGGGRGKKWHHDGRASKKSNSIKDYISCAKYLLEKEIVQENKLAAWGHSAGGLLVASAINCCPDLFRAAVLKAPFLDATNTLLYPILPLTATDYEEFGNPSDINDFHAIREYSPYDNIQKDVPYPSILVSSSFNTRFGVWESAKWVARVRELTVFDPKRPVLFNLTTDAIEENRYLQGKEAALELAFLIKAMKS